MSAYNTAIGHLNSQLPILNLLCLNCVLMDTLYLLIHFFPSQPHWLDSCRLIKELTIQMVLASIQHILALVVICHFYHYFCCGFHCYNSAESSKICQYIQQFFFFSTSIQAQFKYRIYRCVISSAFGREPLLSLDAPKFSSALLLKSLSSFKRYASILVSVSDQQF